MLIAVNQESILWCLNGSNFGVRKIWICMLAVTLYKLCDLGNLLTFQASLFNLQNTTQSLFLNVLYGLNEIIYVIL